MTVDPGALVDPREQEFWESDPTILRQIERIPTPKTPAPILGISLGIAAGVVVTRQIIQHQLAKKSPTNPKEARKVADQIWSSAKGTWKKTVLPSIVDAYKYGAGAVTISQPQLESLAIIYAMDLGEYLNSTSVDALVNGFSAQLNAGANPEVAWQRSAAGYGLDDRQTRKYITNLTEVSRNKYEPMPVPEGARQALDKAMLERADRIGVNEAYKATQMGRNTVWSYMEKTGAIGEGARKRWITAHDERVCPVCAPLDGVTIPLNAQFESNGAKFYAPGVHPNCRCEIILINSINVSKAMPGDPFDRDRNGRFASSEQRRAGNKIGTGTPAPLWSSTKAGIWGGSPVFNQPAIWSGSGPALLNLPPKVESKPEPIEVKPETKTETKTKVKIKAQSKIRAKAKAKAKVKAGNKAGIDNENQSPIESRTEPMMIPASRFINNAHMNARNFYGREAEGSFIHFDGGPDLLGVMGDDKQLVDLDAFAEEMSILTDTYVAPGNGVHYERETGGGGEGTIEPGPQKRSIKFFVFDNGWNGIVEQEYQPGESGYAAPTGWYKIARVEHRAANPETNVYPQAVADQIKNESAMPGYGFVDFAGAHELTSGVVRIHLVPADQSEVDETRILKRAPRLALRRK